jgi:hypothetical protein
MTNLKTYKEFVDRVNELGYMSLSNITEGFPSLTNETLREQWHTGDLESDPWQWKDRAAEEKKLAFGCILGGNKGFVSQRMYPFFYILNRSGKTLEERWADGLVSQEVRELYKLFNTKTLMDTAEIRREMGVTAKKGGSKLDNAIAELQKCYLITVAGNRRKLNKLGQPYGWPANIYDKVDNWVPAVWIENSHEIDLEVAREEVINTGLAFSSSLSEKQLMKILSIK